MRRLFANMLLTVIVATAANAEGPGKGTMEKGPIEMKGSKGEACVAYSVTTRWSLGSLLGTPLVNGSWKWTGDGDCEAHHTTCVLLKIQYGAGYGFIKINPVVPDVNKEYGYNVSGAYDWDELICSYRGTKATDCFDEETAKAFWKNGRIVDFDVVWD